MLTKDRAASSTALSSSTTMSEAAPQAAKTVTPQQLVAPCLQRIADNASGRKYSKLRTDVQVRCCGDQEPLLRCLGCGHGWLA